MNPFFLVSIITLLQTTYECRHCLHILSSQCVICYSICDQLTFLNCTQSQCQDSFVDANGTTQCNQTTNVSYPQNICLANCCDESLESVFEIETLNECKRAKVDESKNIILIVFGVAALLGVVILLSLLRKILQKCDSDMNKKGKNGEEEKGCCEKLINKCCCLRGREDASQNTETDLIKNKKVSKYGKWKRHTSTFQNSNIKCGVCFMGKPNAMTNCGDPLHLRCIIEYVKYDSVCPTCFLPNFNPVKLFCRACSTKYFEIHINFFSSEDEIMKKINGPNCPFCS